MIKVCLREAMENYRKNKGERLNYDILSERTGLSVATLQSIAARTDYNTRLSTIDKLCQALDCSIEQILMLTKNSAEDY